MMLLLAVAASVFVTASVYIPLGHRTYSYKDTPVPSLEAFNRLQGGKKISIANAYGGWFTKEISSEAITCNTTNPKTDLPQIRVHNSFSHAVTVLTCSSDGCSGHDPGNSAYVWPDLMEHGEVLLSMLCWLKAVDRIAFSMK